MNSKPIILIAAAALISATACDRDIESTVQSQHVTFTLSFDGAAAPATRRYEKPDDMQAMLRHASLREATAIPLHKNSNCFKYIQQICK